MPDAPTPPDLLRPPGVVLCSRLKAQRTPENVARLTRLLGEDSVRYMQRRHWA